MIPFSLNSEFNLVLQPVQVCYSSRTVGITRTTTRTVSRSRVLYEMGWTGDGVEYGTHRSVTSRVWTFTLRGPRLESEYKKVDVQKTIYGGQETKTWRKQRSKSWESRSLHDHKFTRSSLNYFYIPLNDSEIIFVFYFSWIQRYR